MFRLTWKSCLIGAVVVATLAVSASQADAWWGWRHWGAGCWGCYTPYYTASYSPYYYSGYGGWYAGYRPGPIRRLVLGRYRWYYGGGYYAGGYYSWPGCCWDTCSWDVCCTDTTASAAPA